MARGWESKSVESQQSEPEPKSAKGPRTPEELERARKREGLELSKARITRELETATSPVHRAALTNALEYLEAELAKLG